MTTTMMKIQKSHSYNQQQLKAIRDCLCDKIEDLLEVLHIEYKLMDKMAIMSCPIHGGDNQSACNLYYVGDSYRGNWKCRTHNCHEVFKSSIIGFIRGCLSRRKYKWSKNGDKVCSFNETIQFINHFLGDKITKDSLSKIDSADIEKNNFVNYIKYVTDAPNSDTIKIPKADVCKKISIPSKYFSERGFDQKVLHEYLVGECYDRNKEMYERAVVPIFDIDNKNVIGCSGRSIFEKCDKCKAYHNPLNDCPSDKEIWKYSKWKHSSGFRSSDSLYNIWKAKDFIKKDHTVIIVESPGNVWKLEEAGIHNSVAIFGTAFSDRQKIMLDCSGAMNIVTIMDNDDAGKQAQEKIYNKCYKTYNIKHINIQKNDVASMSIEEIQNLNLLGNLI